MEMDLLQKEQALNESSNDIKDWRQLPFLASNNSSLALTQSILAFYFFNFDYEHASMVQYLFSLIL